MRNFQAVAPVGVGDDAADHPAGAGCLEDFLVPKLCLGIPVVLKCCPVVWLMATENVERNRVWKAGTFLNGVEEREPTKSRDTQDDGSRKARPAAKMASKAARKRWNQAGWARMTSLRARPSNISMPWLVATSPALLSKPG